MALAFVRKTIGLIAAAYLLYLCLIALVAVPAINGLAPIVFQQQTGRTLQFGDITFDPFTLTARLDHVRNDNPDGSPFFAADQVRVNLALRSLWREPTFDDIALHNLQLQIAQTAADRYNFSDILDHRRKLSAAAPAAPAAAAPPTPVTIRALHVDTGAIVLRAPRLATPVAVRVDNFALDVDDLTTRATAPDQAAALPALALRRLQLAIARVDVELPRQPQPFKTHVTGVQGGLERFSTRQADAQPFTLALKDESGGSVSTTGQLSLAGAQSRGRIDIKNLSLLPAARYLADKLNADYDSGALSLDGNFAVDWKTAPGYRVELRRAEIAGVSARSRADPDTRASLGALVLQNARIDGAARSVRIGSAAVDALQLQGWNRGAQVSLADMFRADFGAADDRADAGAPWSLQLDAFALGSAPQDPSRIDWRTDSIDQERLAIAPLQVNARDLHWPAPQPATLAAAATINGGTRLALEGSLVPATRTGSVEGEVKGLPLAWANRVLAQQLTAQVARGTLDAQFAATLDRGQPTQLQAQGAVADFQLLRTPGRAQVAAWRRMALRQLAVDLPQRRVHIAEIAFDRPELRFRINPDGTTNLHELMVAGPAAADPNNVAATAAPSAPWQTAIDRIQVQGGTLDFRDNSLPRPFRAVIGDFTGTVTGLGSDPAQFARVDLQGSVDGYAPVSLTGTVAPLRAQPALDLALDFTNLDLATLTTYSGTYAGYAINRGLLTLQLAYKLEDRRLLGQNRIVITKLELGEKVASPKAVDLPLRLAIALLTDENGVIDLGVGVEGDLDNPEFSVQGIIWKALRNVIVKAVTSPFRLLAGLVGGSGEEDFGAVDFEAGTDHLLPASRARLGKLVEALAQRPALQLRVIGHSDAGADVTAMKQGKMDYFLAQDGVGDEDLRERNRTWRKAVEKLYEQTFPEREIGAQTPEQLALAVRDGMTLGPEAMSGLAARRALAVKRALVVELGLATDRVLIDAAPDPRAGGDRTQAELKVDT